MKVLICISNVPDTTTKIKFIDNKKFDTAGVQWIINPWDELALTRALEIKENTGTLIEKITVIGVGNAGIEPTIRKALAIGADDAIRVNAEPEDAFETAFQIAQAVKGMEYDIILAGIESSDYNGNSVGGMLAELLEMTSVSSVSFFNIEGNSITLNREIDGGNEVLSISTPFTAIIQKGIAKEPRIPSMRGIMSARTKPLSVIESSKSEAYTSITGFEMPAPKEKCRMLDPEDIHAMVEVFHNDLKVI